MSKVPGVSLQYFAGFPPQNYLIKFSPDFWDYSSCTKILFLLNYFCRETMCAGHFNSM